MLLSLFLTSCTPRIPSPELVTLFPPDSVFKPCDIPILEGDTWGDISSYSLALRTALSLCANQVATLIQWRTQHWLIE
ncbi:Rz1-like lysis system protein LysC [Serratia ureilytica]|uniref:Rz1-like lysis system protein LysC n=1 Tax=Serratia ureilytica TaxID=300181 RepID=UPI003BEEBEB4